MSDVTYSRAGKEDRQEMIDFANLVFSQAREPHDFKALLPKTYADGVQGIEDWHYIAKSQGRIVGLVACRPTPMVYGDRTLDCGFVGTVSVHPYHRGEGHMKALMTLMLQEERRKGRDMLMLGGQKQRYEYFGFEKGGVCVRMDVTARNLRHTAKDLDISRVRFQTVAAEDTELLRRLKAMADSQIIHGVREESDFLRIMHSWSSPFRAVWLDGELEGYVMGCVREAVLRHEEALPLVLKALLAEEACSEASFSLSPAHAQRIAVLSPIAEEVSVTVSDMLQVFNWPKVIEAFLALQARIRPLEDGQKTFLPKGSPAFTVAVRDGVPSVKKEEEQPADFALVPLAMHRLFFDVPNLIRPTGLPASWSPLPFWISDADTF
ncbi:MAG: GNAT family N-acetyltransferase [Clostridia bacterium]|nr:GNAT family N-acetyltransferase [Clostridia bacterium]